MTHSKRNSRRIVVVGGGVAGLSISLRLAQAGFPVTVLEASRLGFGASTRNQGWLHSGGWFAPDHPELARLCHESLQRTLSFCPESLEPNTESMVYLMADAATDPHRWTAAWDAVGIPYHELPPATVFERFPGLALSQFRRAFQLPDRAIRMDLLLRRLAEAAGQAGAEIRDNTPVVRLIGPNNEIQGVETTHGEVFPARLVILAGNAKGGSLFPGFGADAVGVRSDVALMVMKTHLAAVRTEVSRWPLCVVDAEGFNQIPHRPHSVFGTNRWISVKNSTDEQVMAHEMQLLWTRVSRFFPDVCRETHGVREWAGNTVQPMRLEQGKLVEAPLPTVVDHARESQAVNNLLSVFPGRASLWPRLAELTRQAVLEKVDPVQTDVAAPPWTQKLARHQLTESPQRLADKVLIYHCQRCGSVVAREQDLAVPLCCETPMAQAAERARSSSEPLNSFEGSSPKQLRG